ncbi:ABC transporter permease [bacterium]|nr:ABC transporter permease [bacterium]
MNFWESILTAFTALRSNRLRSLLTMLGIIIGVGAVIAMVAIGEGSRRRINERMKNLGTNLLIVRPGAQNVGRTVLAAGSSITLTTEDGAAIKARSEWVQDFSPELSRNSQVKFENKNANTSVIGASTTYPRVRNYTLASGRFFNEDELRAKAKVAIVGQTVADQLFERASPVGQTIKINGQNFHVIGQFEKKGSTGMQDQDDQIVIPLTTAQLRLFGLDYINNLAVMAKDNAPQEEVTFDIERTLRRQHRLRSDQENDFSIRNMSDIVATAQETSATLSLLLASIAAISLIVGGIGIMNIMVVSVTERTKEIGIRKAIGAKRRDILAQFLIEALMICLLGGFIGILAGTGTALFLQYNAGWSVVITSESILLSFGLSVAIGIFFGFYPAWKAANSHVIDALRYE